MRDLETPITTFMPRNAFPEPRLIVHDVIDPALQAAQLLAGLLQSEARISPKYFYDAQGAALFSAICALDEYYPTRTEAAIFTEFREEIARSLPAGAQWIDLGCGDAAKSRQWLRSSAHISRFVGADIAQEWLEAAIVNLSAEFAPLECVGVVTDFTRALHLHDVLGEHPESPAVFFYPGSSIGNFTPDEATAFLRTLGEHLDERGRLLIGVDLVKETDVLEAAYNDALGVTAAFNRNVLRVTNRLLDADFNPGGFDHRAFFRLPESRIEMQLVSTRDQSVRLDGEQRRFKQDEPIVTEYSYKYTPERFSALLGAAGFQVEEIWRDDREWFGIFLAAPLKNA